MQIEKGKPRPQLYMTFSTIGISENKDLKIWRICSGRLIGNLQAAQHLQIKPTPDQEAIMDEVLKDILNMGKKGGSS